MESVVDSAWRATHDGPVLARWIHALQCLAVPAHASLRFGAHGVVVARGAPSPGWVADCADVARELGVTHGRLDVVGPPGALRLRFSPDLPQHGRQRFHNVLGLHRSSLLLRRSR